MAGEFSLLLNGLVWRISHLGRGFSGCCHQLLQIFRRAVSGKRGGCGEEVCTLDF